MEGIKQIGFEALLFESGIISIHMHLTPENKKITNGGSGKMKPGAVIINTLRGAVTDETSFLRALEPGKSGTAGLDATDGQRMLENAAGHPLMRSSKSMITCSSLPAPAESYGNLIDVD